jgi:hypothetical protein
MRTDPIVLPADKDRLARWQGDHAALLARLQESFADYRLLTDLAGAPGPPAFQTTRQKILIEAHLVKLVGQLIREAVEHFEEMPR